MGTEYCASCGRCQTCGAKRGAQATVFVPTMNVAAANPITPIVIETFNGGGAGAPIMGCEHFEIRG